MAVAGDVKALAAGAMRSIGRWGLVDGNTISQYGQMPFSIDPDIWHWVTAWFDWEAKKARFQVYLDGGVLIHESFEQDLTISTATSANRVVFMRPQAMSIGATRFDFLAYQPGATGPLPPWMPDVMPEPEPPPEPA